MPEHQTGHPDLNLLRSIARNLVVRPLPQGPVTQDVLRAEGLGRARRNPDALVGILRSGVEAFSELSEKTFRKIPGLERGTAFSGYQEEFLTVLLSRHLGKDITTIVDADVLAIEKHFADWFSGKAAKRTIFVPCMISPWPSPRFSIGPVSFIFLNDVSASEYYPHGGPEDQLNVFGFDSLIAAMRNNGSHWLAVIDIDGCDQQRSIEVGDLAVDLGIVALQLAAPYLGTKNMSRLATRRGPRIKETLSAVDSYYYFGSSNTEPGIPIGNGYLKKIVCESSLLITAVGNCIHSFTTGSYRLPNLEQAWCDAAYWLHQGLGEPLDSIAVAKLETAIEVLLRAESTRGSQSRIEAALDTFYGLAADEHITTNSQITARQFAKGFVRDRSRVLHGTWSTLNVRLESSRESLENLAVTLVRASAMELDAYIQTDVPADDVDAFLAWTKSQRRQRATKR
jgi:hypothetical protein